MAPETGMLQDFEELAREHGARIRRIARRYAAPGQVDDLVQEILVQLWRSYPSFRSEAKIETWIYRVALNTAMTHVKRSIRDREIQAAIDARSESVPATQETTSMGDILASFLAVLGDIDASILMMYLDGLSAEEMSGVLGISANAIGVRINRLKQKFSDTYVE
jgi:RNA polymerase sigma-70 factor (ECF subfamily)